MTEWFQSIFLGIIQGLTEFLPVSSSGHLTIFQHFLGMNEAGITFDILLHAATLVSVIICYRKDIWGLLKHPFQKYVLMIIIACIPAGIAGVFFGDFVSNLFDSVWVPAFALLITATILFIADRQKGSKTGRDITVGIALFIGLFQMIALVPGISRSGSTIFAALLCGLMRTEAAKFSFIMSIPVILGAFLLEVKDVVVETGGFYIAPAHIAGAIAALISGILAIKLVVNLLNNGKFRYFGIYCTCFALVTIILLALGM